MTTAQARRADDLLTCREVAEMYRVQVETVRRWVRKGVITVILVGPYRHVRIPKTEADKHFEVVPGAKT